MSKKSTFVFLFIVFCFLAENAAIGILNSAIAIADVPVNLIQNGGFETGVFSPWLHNSAPAGSGSETIADSGYQGKCLKLDPGTSTIGQYAYQIVQVVPGKAYRFSAKFKTTLGHYAYINLHDTNWKDKNGAVVKKSFTIMSQGTGSWEDIALSLTIPLKDDSGESTVGHTWYVIVYGHTPLGEGSIVYYDEASLEEVAVAAAYSQIEELLGWTKETELFTEGYPLEQPNAGRFTLQNGELTLKGDKNLRNLYSITIPVLPDTRYKLSVRLKVEDRVSYNYLSLRKPNDPSQPLYPPDLSSLDPNVFTNLRLTKGIWGGRYSINIYEGGRMLNIAPPVDLGMPYVHNEDIDTWFTRETSLRTLPVAGQIKIQFNLEGFDGKLIIDDLKLEEADGSIEDKYLNIPIGQEFQGMKIEEVSRNPLFVRTNAAKFLFSDNSIEIFKDGQPVNNIIFGSGGFLAGLNVTEAVGIVNLENSNIKLSIGADSVLIAKLKTPAILNAQGPRPNYHNFEAGVIFATDYTKGVYFTPLRSEQEIAEMPRRYNADTIDYTYEDSDFAELGLKNWQLKSNFNGPRWDVEYSFSSKEGFLAAVFPPKEFSYAKYFKEVMRSVPGFDTYAAEGGYAYVVQKMMENVRVAMIWSSVADQSRNNLNPPQEYWVDANNNPVAPPPYGPADARRVALVQSRDIAGPYKVWDTAKLDRFVTEAHAQGLKVIVYTTPLYYYSTDADVYINNIDELISRNKLDGFYYDGLPRWNVLKSLEVARKTRNRLFDKFYTQHNSWDFYSMAYSDHLRLPFIDAYADRLWVGENNKKDTEDSFRLNYAGKNVGNTPSCLLAELRPVDYSKSRQENERDLWQRERQLAQIDKQLEYDGEFYAQPAVTSNISDRRYSAKVTYSSRDYWDKFWQKSLPYTCGDGACDAGETPWNCPQDAAPETNEAVLSKAGDTYSLSSPYQPVQWVIDGRPFYRLHFTFDGDIVSDDSSNKLNPSYLLGMLYQPPIKESIDGKKVFRFNRDTRLFGDTEGVIDFNNNFSSFAVIKRASADNRAQGVFALNDATGTLFEYGLNSSSKPVVSFKRGNVVAGTEEIVTSEHYEGAKAVRMQHNDATWQATSQNLPGGVIIPGNTYTFACYFKTAASHQGFIKLRDIDWKDTSGRVIGKEYYFLSFGNGAWSQISRTIAIPTMDDYNEPLDNHRWQVYLYGHYPVADASAIYYDNVTLISQGDTTNLITNPSFEDDFSRWSHLNITALDELSGGNTLNDANWHTVGVIYDKPALKLYLDGVKIAERAVNLKPFTENCVYFAGARANNVNYFDGYIDDLFATDSALSDAQALEYHQTQHKTLTLAGANQVSCIINKNGQKFSARFQDQVNHPPVLAPIGNKSLKEGGLLEFTVSATDSDGDLLTYSAQGLPQGASFDAITRIFSWRPGYEQAGIYQVTFSVTDAEATDSEQISIIVDNVDHSSNLVRNSGFENNLTDWLRTGSGTAVVIPRDDTPEGVPVSNCLRIKAQTTPVAVYQEMGSLIPGETYIFQAMFKTTFQNMGYITLWDYDWKDASGVVKGKGFTRLLYGSDVWRKLSNVVTIPLADDSGESTMGHRWRVYLYSLLPNGNTDPVYYDDAALLLGNMYLPVFGIDNNSSVKSIDFGSSNEGASGITYNTASMASGVSENGITFRSIKPANTLILNIPAFNVDGNGLPLTPMLLEVKFKDTIDDKLYNSSSANMRHRALLYSKIDFTSADPLTSRYREQYLFGYASGIGDNQWRYKQYVFSGGAFPLLRAINGRFQIRITMPNLGPDDANLFFPIDYISLRRISQAEYETFSAKQRELLNFYQVELPPDGPAIPIGYSDPNLVVFVRDIMQPVYRHTRPAPEESSGDLSAVSAPGETEPLSFAIYSAGGVNNLSFNISDLVNPVSGSRIPSGAIKLFKVAYGLKRLGNAYGASGFSYGYAEVPDRLEEINSLSVDPETSQRLWLKAQIPEGLAAGYYLGTIEVVKDGLVKERLNVNIELLGLKLDSPRYFNFAWHDPYYLTYSTDMGEVLKFFKEMGWDPYFQLTESANDVVPVVRNGRIVDYDTRIFEEKLARVKQEGILKRAAGVDLNALWNNVVYKTACGALLSSADTQLYYKLKDSRFVEAFGLLVNKLKSIAEQNSVSVIFSTIDEPGNNPYKRIVADRLFSIIKDNGGLSTATYYSTCDDAIPSGDYAAPNGTIPPLTNLIDYKLWAPIFQGAGYQKNYPHYGYYTTIIANVNNAVYNRMQHSCLPLRTDTELIQDYAVGHYINDPYNDFDAEAIYQYPFTYPDFLFAYPTYTGKILSTMSSEGIREGIKDAKYIATLERLIRERPNSPVAREAAAYLSALRNRIKPDYWNDYALKSDRFGYEGEILKDLSSTNGPQDYASFTRIREDIADFIKRFTKEPPVLNSIGNKSATEGQLLSFIVSAADPNGDTLTFSASNLPQGATFDSATQVFRWVPAVGQAGVYQVVFTVSDGELEDSEVITINVVNLMAPSGLTSTNINPTSITLNWRYSSSNESGFRIERSMNQNGPFARIHTAGSNFRRFSNYGLSANTTYYYRVKAYNLRGESVPSNTLAVTTSDVPAVPSNLRTTRVTSTSIALRWQDNSNNENGFKVERSLAAEGPFATIYTSGANVTKHTSYNLSAGTTYYYRLKGYNSGGDSAASEVLAVTTLPR